MTLAGDQFNDLPVSGVVAVVVDDVGVAAAGGWPYGVDVSSLAATMSAMTELKSMTEAM